jgi:S-adenosylmethionine synthetase
LCDQISDAIVDSFLQQDPFSRIITECAVSTGVVFIAARYASDAKIDFADVARKIILQSGYEQDSFNAEDATILTSLGQLAPYDHPPTDEQEMSDEEIDQVTVKNQANAFGFACNQTTAKMPLPIWLARRLSHRLSALRFESKMPYICPDGSSRVGIEYRDSKPYRIHSITLLVSQQAADSVDAKTLREEIIEHVIKPVFARENLQPDDKTDIFINPDGPFIEGGPSVHSGLTGRKNAVDTYGEYCRLSGSALSGKDPSRIDRIGAYAARYAAKNVVAAGLADECEVQLSYCIGCAQPASIEIETFGTGLIDEHEIVRRLKENFDFRIGGIIREFNLRYLPSTLKGGFYRKLAASGHVGRMDIGLPWEKTDRAESLR